MAQRKEFTNEYFRDVEALSDEAKRTIVTKLAKTANNRIRRLDKSNRLEYSYVYKQIAAENRQKFFRSTYKKATKTEIERSLGQLQEFLQSASSTAAGVDRYKEMLIKARDTINQKAVNSDAKIKDDIPLHVLSDFFQSDTYRARRKYVNSEELIETFFEEFYDTETDFDMAITAFSDYVNSTYSEAEEAFLREKARSSNFTLKEFRSKGGYL